MVLNACAADAAPNEELRNLLEYIREGSVAPGDELVDAMEAEVSVANEDREWVSTVMTVDDWIEENIAIARDAALAEGRAEGLAEGRAEGRAEGVSRMTALTAKLAEDGHREDALAILADPVATEEYLRKYNL